jgi:lipid-A-disaccharide synthase
MSNQRNFQSNLSNGRNALQVMIIVGDPSGDIHTAHVVTALKKLQPDCDIFGVGGEHMVPAGFQTLVPIEKMAVMGFVEVLKHLRFFSQVSRRLLQEIERRKPQVIMLVDYPGFNIRFAKRIRRQFPPGNAYQPKIIYYISPQVWAWKPERIHTIARLIDFMAVVFPFEVELYENVGLPVEFVGHPLLDLPPPRTKEELLKQAGIGSETTIVGLLPGSRVQEVQRHLPVFLDAVDLLRRNHPELRPVVAASHTVPSECYLKHQSPGRNLKVLYGWTREVMQHSGAACVVSGTATLETAILGTPLVVVYKTNPITYWIARSVVRVPYISMVNIIAGEPVAKELLQKQVTSRNLAQEMESLLFDDNRRQTMVDRLRHIRDQLGQPGSGKRLARRILDLAGRDNQLDSTLRPFN